MNGRSMTAQVERYLTLRRAVGFELGIAGRQLMQFARFVESTGSTLVTLEIAVAWANAGRDPTPLSRARRIELIRPFARFLQQLDENNEVPDRNLFGPAHRRLTPHIFSDSELEQLLAQAADLPPTKSVWPIGYQTLFGLIASTGLRLGEALRLEIKDIDSVDGRLLVRRTKFRKSRWVPLHPTVVDRLERYRMLRSQRGGFTERFFVDPAGNALDANRVDYVFKKLCSTLGWQARGGHPFIRITDLRHSFITHTLAHWQAQGAGTDQFTLALSTYVGHTKITDTYWYLTAMPELLQTANDRFEGFAQGDDHG